jgi:uncharacterized protein YndB with AHSA1/START domain
MTAAAETTQSVIVERELPHPPERVWRALTEDHLIDEWLMKNDFKPIVGHRFKLTADWGAVDGEVLTVEPHKTLAYTWRAFGMGHVVRWTLAATSAGTHLRMEQSGFGPDQQQAYHGARAGWPRFVAALEQVLARMTE